MDGLIEYAFPAGEESDDSDEEWDVGRNLEKPLPPTANLISHVEDNVFMLKKAISKGDIKTVEKLLDNGMDVETRLGFGWSLLMCAVNMANYDLAKLLLERGASANFSKDNWTALMASCTASASEDKISHCMELLLSRNADPNVANSTQ